MRGRGIQHIMAEGVRPCHYKIPLFRDVWHNAKPVFRMIHAKSEKLLRFCSAICRMQIILAIMYHLLKTH